MKHIKLFETFELRPYNIVLKITSNFTSNYKNYEPWRSELLYDAKIDGDNVLYHPGYFYENKKEFMLGWTSENKNTERDQIIMRILPGNRLRYRIYVGKNIWDTSTTPANSRKDAPNQYKKSRDDEKSHSYQYHGSFKKLEKGSTDDRGYFIIEDIE